MVISCCVYGCKQKFFKGCGVTFYHFPKNVEWRKQWIKALKRENFEPPVSARVCSKHFEEHCFNRETSGDIRLHSDAVPTKFTFPQPGETVVSNTVWKECFAGKKHRPPENLFWKKHTATTSSFNKNIVYGEEEQTEDENNPVFKHSQPVYKNVNTPCLNKIPSSTITSGVLIPLKDHLINKVPTINEDDLQAVETNNMSDANSSDSEQKFHSQSTVEELRDVLGKIKLGTLLIGLDDEDREEKILRLKMKYLRKKLRKRNKTMKSLVMKLNKAKKKTKVTEDAINMLHMNYFDGFPIELLLKEMKTDRQSDKIKDFLFDLYCHSSEAYNLIKTLLKLRHSSTISCWINAINNCDFEILGQIISFLKVQNSQVDLAMDFILAFNCKISLH